jgi:multiple sugar transport system substrate-binding protein
VTTLRGATGCRLSTWRDPEVLQNQSFYAITSEINTGNVNTLPKMPQYTEFNDILNEAVEAVVVDQSATPAEALAEAADRTRELL